jgi:hypothetical protein
MGSSGGSFGSTGGSSGSSGGSSGSSFNIGGFTLGNMSGGNTSRTSASSNRLGATSLLGASFANPLLPGLGTTLTGSAGPLISFPNTNSGRSGTFGQPMYTISNTGSATLRGGSITGGSGGAASISRTTPFFASSIGVRRTAPYSTEPRFRFPEVTLGRVHAEASAVLANSPRLESRGNIQLLMDGPVFVLRGTVLDEEERQVAADLLRLTPGVYEIRNELTVRNP